MSGIIRIRLRGHFTSIVIFLNRNCVYECLL